MHDVKFLLVFRDRRSFSVATPLTHVPASFTSVVLFTHGRGTYRDHRGRDLSDICPVSDSPPVLWLSFEPFVSVGVSVATLTVLTFTDTIAEF